MEPSVTTAPQWATLQVASCNVLNLSAAQQETYANQPPLDAETVARKLDWLGQQIARLKADVVGFQEIWHESALQEAVERSGWRQAHVCAPGAEQGATGTPRVGLATRLTVESIDSVTQFDETLPIVVPDVGPATRFERPVLHARLRMKHGQPLQVLVVHLKSKRPKFLQDADGRPIEDTADPGVVARATLRSLVLRAAEALALRRLVIEVTQRTRTPLLLLGDLNDGPHAVTTQLIAATGAAGYDRQARDTALYHAWDVQTEPALRRDMAYSHVHQGWPELLDQIWVSEEFVSSSKMALGDVRRVEVFNDHLHEGRERWRSDHGFVRALMRLRLSPGV